MKNLIPTLAVLASLAIAGIEAKQYRSATAAADSVAAMSTSSNQAVPPPCYPFPSCPSDNAGKKKVGKQTTK